MNIDIEKLKAIISDEKSLSAYLTELVNAEIKPLNETIEKYKIAEDDYKQKEDKYNKDIEDYKKRTEDLIKANSDLILSISNARPKSTDNKLSENIISKLKGDY